MPLFIRHRAFYLLCMAGTGYYLYRTVVLVLPHLGPERSDFSVYHAAAQALLSGHSPFSADGFIYPPLLALLLMPLALLEYESARWVWFGISHCFLFGAAWFVWRVVGGDRTATLVVVLVWAAGGAAAESLMLGQLNPFLLVLVAASWYFSSNNKSLGGGSLGTAAAAKIWPGSLIFAYVLCRDWKSLVSAATVVGLLALVPWFGVSLLLPPPHAPPVFNAWMGTPALFNFSVPAVVLRALDPPEDSGRMPRNWEFGNSLHELQLTTTGAWISVGTALGTFGLGLVLLFASTRYGAAKKQQHLVMISLVALSLAASPVAWSHYQLLQYPGVVLLLGGFARQRRFGWAVGSALLFLGLYQLPIMGLGWYLQGYGWTAANPMLLWLLSSLTPVCSLALFGLCLNELRRCTDIAVA